MTQGHYFYYECFQSNLLNYDGSFDYHGRQAHKARNITGSLITSMGNTDFFLIHFLAILGGLAHVKKVSSSFSAEQGHMLTG